MYENIFQIKSNNLKPEKGRVLLASPLMNDYHFTRTAVMMVNNEEEGSMGIIINKHFKFNITLNSLIEGLDNIPPISVYKGGPVGRNTLFFIHDMEEIEHSFPLGNGTFMNGNFDQMLDYIKSGKPTDGRVRFYMGYSGWEKDQLEKEIQENSWIISSISKDLILESNITDIWHVCLENMGEPYSLWAKYPVIPELN